MDQDKIKKIYEIVNNIRETPENSEFIGQIREDLLNQDYMAAIKKLEILTQDERARQEEYYDEDDEEEEGIYPKKLSNIELEHIYAGLLLSDPKYIVKYYFVHDECYFEDEAILNIYKSVLFTEGAAYAPEIAKKDFNFARDSEAVYKLKNSLRAEVANGNYDMEQIYLNLKKLFVLRKNYLAIPIKSIQDKVVEITDYILYDKMC